MNLRSCLIQPGTARLLVVLQAKNSVANLWLVALQLAGNMVQLAVLVAFTVGQYLQACGNMCVIAWWDLLLLTAVLLGF